VFLSVLRRRQPQLQAYLVMEYFRRKPTNSVYLRNVHEYDIDFSFRVTSFPSPQIHSNGAFRVLRLRVRVLDLRPVQLALVIEHEIVAGIRRRLKGKGAFLNRARCELLNTQSRLWRLWSTYSYTPPRRQQTPLHLEAQATTVS